jgi:hypothetical protein
MTRERTQIRLHQVMCPVRSGRRCHARSPRPR